MLDLEVASKSQHDYYANLPTDTHGINSIEQFAFSDHNLVPELFQNFAIEYFNLERWRRCDLDELNRVLNELWEGPGSAAKISDAIWDIRRHRRAGTEPKDSLKGYDTPTIDSDLDPVLDDKQDTDE